MIRALIFDIGNVLLRFDFGLALRRLEPWCRVPAAGIPEAIDRLKHAYEGGRIGRAEFLKEAFLLLGYRGTEAAFVSAWEEIFEENRPMIQLVEELHGRYPLYLLSNTSDIHLDYVVKQYPVFGRFRDGVYSHLAGCCKPERAIYELAARRFGVEPGETVFIDDLAANVAAAREAGFQAIQYDFRQHALLLGELAKLGIG